MAVSSPRPAANGFVAAMRKMYQPIGFSKGYNFVLWFIFVGAMMGFALARTMYLNYNGVFCSPDESTANHAGPGECWSYSTKDVYKIGIQMHLYTIIPAGLLVCFQFVPVIRHKVLLFHRINGYLVMLLAVFGVIGALMIAKVSFGGGIEIQTLTGVLAIMFLGSLGLAFYNIKKLQIEQHRAWMLRAWFYAGVIITTRLIFFIAAIVISSMDGFYESMSCHKLQSFYDTHDELVRKYSLCGDMNEWASVKADMGGDIQNAGAALDVSFGMGTWLALVVHAVGVEVYLRLTPAESERLRNVSYQRQLEAGAKFPGRAGLTADRIGDAAIWIPERECLQRKQVSDEALAGAEGPRFSPSPPSAVEG